MVLALGNHRKGADRRAGAALDFQGRCDQDRAFGGQLVEVGKACQTKAIVAVQQVVRGIRRVHRARLARVRADALAAPADDLFRQEIFDAIWRGAGAVGATLVGVEEFGLVAGALPVLSACGRRSPSPRGHSLDSLANCKRLQL